MCPPPIPALGFGPHRGEARTFHSARGLDVPPTDERKAPFSGPSVPGDHRTSGSMHGPAQSAEARTGTEPWIRRHGRTAAAAYLF